MALTGDQKKPLSQSTKSKSDPKDTFQVHDNNEKVGICGKSRTVSPIEFHNVFTVTDTELQTSTSFFMKNTLGHQLQEPGPRVCCLQHLGGGAETERLQWDAERDDRKQ